MDAPDHSSKRGHGGSKEQREDNRGWANLSYYDRTMHIEAIHRMGESSERRYISSYGRCQTKRSPA